ncbi:MAG: glucose-1-phosphate thymidylyltransferase [Spirochaetales bacterium]|nr:glucose-1-phosphate thymidylyltransferase [Leptospiraceae bacterium]MCP5482982.1 glucose-1-phosphate thymidylyltransferase [Spirochaetales bacterium]MCP5484839.1 glucose-1-phosphate thymidylyltransferase [Spirochaetales bacterium]
MSPGDSALLVEPERPEWAPLTRVRSAFSFRNGIFSPLERLRRNGRRRIHYYCPHAKREQLVAGLEEMHSLRAVAGSRLQNSLSEELRKEFATSEEPPDLFSLLASLGPRIEADLSLWLAGPVQLAPDTRLAQVTVVGPRDRLFIDGEVELLPGVVIDTREGSVILSDGVRVSSFSYLAGPLFVAPGARLDNVRVAGGCVIGREVRLGGEVENCIVDDFSNKHHEGFIGHSLIGRWVNLGAITTTSDLKNNYGNVRMQVGPGLSLDTNQIKFGSIIGDCVKTAIGTMLNTGTVIDFGANVFGGPPPPYLPPFSWGNTPETRYEQDRFEADCTRIFGRRRQTPAPEMFELARLLRG